MRVRVLRPPSRGEPVDRSSDVGHVVHAHQQERTDLVVHRVAASSWLPLDVLPVELQLEHSGSIPGYAG